MVVCSGLIRRFVNSSARIAGVLINGTLQQPSEGLCSVVVGRWCDVRGVDWSVCAVC